MILSHLPSIHFLALHGFLAAYNGSNAALHGLNNNGILFYALLITLLITWFLTRIFYKKQLIHKLGDLETSERILRQVTDNMTDMVCQTDMLGNIEYLSPSHERILGYNDSELIGTPVFDIIHPDDSDKIKNTLANALRSDLPDRIEFRYRTATDRYIWIEATGSLLYNKNDDPVGAVFGCRDITNRKISEELLWKHAQLQNNLLSAVPALVYLKDIDFKYIEVNERLTQLLGLDKNMILGKTDYDLFPEEMADIYYYTDVEVTTRKQEKFHIVSQYQTLDGRSIFLSTSKMPYYNQEGEMVGLAGVSVDVTEAMQAEEKLHITQFAVDNASQSVVMTDEFGTIMYINQYAKTLFNDTTDNIIGKKLWDFDNTLSALKWTDFWADLRLSKSRIKTVKIRNSIGQEHTLESYFNFLTYLNKEYCINYSIDITDRNETEEKLKASESRYRMIIENINDVVWILDLNLTTTFITPSIKNLTGYTAEEHIGQRIEEKFTKASVQTINTWYQHYIPKLLTSEIDHKNFILKGELEYHKKEGGTIWTEMTIKLVTDQNNKLIGLHGTSINIDERKKAELDLRASRERYKAIYDNIRDVYYEVLMDNTLIEISPSFEKFSSYTREEVLGKSIYNFYKDPRQRDDMVENITKYGAVTDYEIALKDKDNRVLDCSITASLIRDEHGNPYKICGTIRDISERKQALRKLLESEERYKTLVDLSPNPIMVLKNSHYVYANTSAIAFLGCSNLTEIKALNPLLSVHPDDRDKIFSILKNKSELNKQAVELRVIKKSGEVVNTISTAIPIFFEGEQAVLIVSQDVSEMKNVEAELLHAKIRAEDSDRLKTAFLANMSHEIRTPLNGIIGFAGLLYKPNLTKEKLQQYAQIINSGSHQLLAIINDIIDISKIEAGQMSINNAPVHLNLLMNELFIVYKALAEKKDVKMTLECSLHHKNAEIISDETKLKQILNNLLNNALKFTHEGFINIGYNISGKFIEFYVKDSGIGIPEEFQRIVFERFRQVEMADTRKYGGTGLGLSISKALVNLMGGTIRLDSEPKKGTSFYFTLPYEHSAESNLSNKIADENEIVYDWTGKTILIAEDEEANYFFMQEMLEETGIQILIAENGKLAIEVFDEHPDVDIIMLDIKMPEVNGYDVLKYIKSKNKTIPVVAQTAYAMSNDKFKALEAGFDSYIAKPIERLEFLSVINKLIV